MEDFDLEENVNDVIEDDIEYEIGEMIEYEFDESISFLYDKDNKKYFIYYIDYNDTCDEFTYEINDDFDGMEIDGIMIKKEDFEEFKLLVSKTN